jgi:hypothetical protein
MKTTRIVLVMFVLVLGLLGATPAGASQNDCVATAAAPTNSEGASVPCSQDLSGNTRTTDNDQTGSSINHRISAGTTEDETEIKATAGRLLSISATNTNAAVRYLRCANLTAANTTPGTSAVFFGIALPAGGGIAYNFGPSGIAFSTALTCWLVTGAAETDVAEVAANEINWNIGFK